MRGGYWIYSWSRQIDWFCMVLTQMTNTLQQTGLVTQHCFHVPVIAAPSILEP